MDNRKNPKGQALVYFGMVLLVFVALAAAAVDVGRHVFVGREAQAVADATALAGATALARGSDAYSAAMMFAPQDTVDGIPAQLAISDIQVGNWSSGTFTAGGSPSNAVHTTPHFTINNIFGLWSPISLVSRQAVAAFAPAPTLPIALCDQTWTSGVTLKFSTSNSTSTSGNTAAWAVYNPTATSFPGMDVVRRYFPTLCGGGGLTPPQEIIGTSLYLGNGTGPLFSANSCPTLQQCLTNHTYLFPITDVQCYGPLNQQHAIIGFTTAQIDSVDCSNNIIYGHAVGNCSTNAAACASVGLVE